jgi:hypothetical protein
MMIGRNAIFGIGKPTEMIGSKNHRAIFERAITVASAMPQIEAMTNPVRARNSVSPRLIQRMPLTASL